MNAYGAAAITTLAATTMAAPLAGRGTGVQVFPTTISGGDKNSFPSAPSELDQEQKDFLSKYQPLSDAAVKAVSPINENHFAAAGFCYSDYPCLSVNKAAVGTIGDKEEVEREQVAAILDELTSSDQATFGKIGNAFTGLTITKDGAVLDVIAEPGTMDSKALGGMVFDMFKLQADDVSTNSIRATKAQTDGQDAPHFALCLHPEGTDSQETFNFCVGKELDGSTTPSPSMAKRQGGLSDLVCGLIDIPLIC